MKFYTFVYIFYFIIYYVFSQNILLLYGATCPDKKIIVDMHNEYRRKVALGEVKRQPKASNMQQLAWDDKLATEAQEFAKQMKIKFDEDRHEPRSLVGQNIYLWNSTQSTVEAFYWNTVIKRWFDRNQQYTFGTTYNLVSPYTQMVWAETNRIGCGGAFFKNNNKFYCAFYVCNYAPSGNINGVAPYEVGSGCDNLCNVVKPAQRYGRFC